MTGPYKGREREIWGTEVPGSESQVKTETEIGGMRAQNNEHQDFWQTPEAGRAGEGPSPRALGGTQSC